MASNKFLVDIDVTGKIDVTGSGTFGGNVGIGTDSPDAKLHIQNGSSGQTYTNLSGALIDVNGTSNSYSALRVGSSTGNNHLVVTNAGNVGIGTNNPSQKLVVAGNIMAVSSTITAYNGSTEYAQLSTANLTINNGGSKVVINSNGDSYLNGGNVGIGTTSPGYKLHVDGGGMKTTTATLNRIAYYDGNGIGAYSSTGYSIQNYTNHLTIGNNADDKDIIFKASAGSAASVEIMRVDGSSGNVGIGTTSPTEKLTVSGNILISDTGNDKYFGSNVNLILNADADENSGALARNIIFQNRGSEKMRIDADGHVGIGTDSPAEKLDVSGNIQAYNTYADGVSLLLNHNNLYASSIIKSISDSIDTQDSGSSMLRFYTNDNSSTQPSVALDLTSKSNAIFYGNVGIGTTTPSEKLEVNGDIKLSNNSDRIKFGTSGTSGSWGAPIMTRIDSSIIISDYGGVQLGGYDGTNYGARMTVLGTGNVGIGTTSPSAVLQVGEATNIAGALSAKAKIVVDAANTTDINNVLNLISKYNGSPSASAGSGPALLFSGGIGDAQTRTYAKIVGKYSHSNMGGLGFHTQDTADIITEKMTILPSSGYVGIGTTLPTTALDVDGVITAVGGDSTEWNSAYANQGNYLPLSGGTLTGASTIVSTLDIFTTANARATYPQMRVGRNSGEYIGMYTNDRSSYLVARQDETDDGLASMNFQIWSSGGGANEWRWDGANNDGTSEVRAMTLTKDGDLTVTGKGTFGNTITSSSANIDFNALQLTSSGANVTFNFEIGDTGISGLNAKNLVIKGSSATSDIAFSPSTANPGSVVFKGDGNVGIGTTSPQSITHINDIGLTKLKLTETNLGSGSGDGLDLMLDSSANAYIYNRENGTLIFGTNNAERFRIDSSGNVGIGTTTPSSKLSIAQGELAISNLSPGFTNPMGVIGAYNQDANNGGLLFKTISGAVVTEKMRILANGNVGIGETNPGAKLDVAGNIRLNTTGNELQFSNHSVGAYRDTANRLIFGGYGGIRFQSENVGGMENQATRMAITAAGNVGIGTTSPNNKLDVAGTISATNIRLGSSVSGEGVIRHNPGSGNGIGIVTGSINSSSIGLFVGHSSINRNVGIGTESPASKLSVDGGIQMADDSTTASSSNVGTQRYRTSGNNSYVDMCMQTGAATYAWINIVQNNW